MKTKNILGLVVLGVIAWFFLKPKKVLADEVSAEEAREEIPENKIIIEPSLSPIEIKRIIKERPCFLADYPCVQWYRTTYKSPIQ